MSRLILMTVSVLLLTTVAVAPASARSRLQKPEHSWDNLRKLRVGEEIQVVYQEEQYLNGRFLGFTPEGISVQWGVVNIHKEMIPRKDVIRVISWKRTRRVKNALIGLGMGAAGGAAFGAGLAHEAKHQGKDTGFPTIAIPIGAAAGAVLGALNPDHETLYQTPGPGGTVVTANTSSVLVNPKCRRLEQSWDNLRTLRIFQKVRVLDQELNSHDGKFLSVSDEAISLDAGQGEVTIERADVLVVKAERPQNGGQSGFGNRAETITVYSAGPWENLSSSRVEQGTRVEDQRDQSFCGATSRGISGEPACCYSSETTTWGDFAGCQYDRETTEIKTVRRERKRRDSRRSRIAASVLTTAPIPAPAAAEVPTELVEAENPAEQPEAEVGESSTPDFAEPPSAEDQANTAPMETEMSQPEESDPVPTEER